MLIRPNIDKFAKIMVVGVGGGGGNAINTMIAGGQVQGVDFVAINTDKQALSLNMSPRTLPIGHEITGGLGSGAVPEVGKKAAEESGEDIKKMMEGYDMIFVTSGMGGGTGTGASPVVAQIAKDLGALTVAVVTKPFKFEGPSRMENANRGISELGKSVDALITIPNQKLLEMDQKDLPLIDAFKLADDVLANGVRGISDLIVQPGMINLDFADVRTVMQDAGTALMGVGESTEGDKDRALEAVQAAVKSPLLDRGMEGASKVLLNIMGDNSISMSEVEKVASHINECSQGSPNIIFGTALDKDMGDKLRVTVIATGFDDDFVKDIDTSIAGGFATYKTKNNNSTSSKTGDSADNEEDIDSNIVFNEKDNKQNKKDKSGKIFGEPDDEMDYEIPTFLRRS